MAIDFYPMHTEVNAVATFRKSTPTGSTTGYGRTTQGPDPSTDTTVNVLVTPFDVIRRLAYIEAMDAAQDIRLWWLATETPMIVNPDDVFIVVEHGVTVNYIVQMVDPDTYEIDMTVCICKKE